MFQDIINPANFADVIGQVGMSSAADVDEVLRQAENAFPTWSLTTAEHRASRLTAAAIDLRTAVPDLATLFVRENGKTVREAEIDIRRSIELIEIIASDLVEWS